MRYLLSLCIVLLGGCALMAPPAPVVHPPSQIASAPFALNGRISVRHQGEVHSAGLRWMHQARSDEILLLAPLGQTVARVYRDAGQATLDKDGKHYREADAETLMQRVLGWHLPLAGLHHWVLGMAAQHTPADIEYDKNNRIVRLLQDGWEINYLRFADDRRDSLPSRLQLIREDLRVTLLIDEWDWAQP